MWFLILIFTFIIIYVYSNLSEQLQYWNKRNVPYIKQWPFSKKSLKDVFRKETYLDTVRNSYNAFPEKRYYGTFSFFKPVLVIRDLDLIKNITVKWFDAFSNHTGFISSNADPFWRKNLFALKDWDGWHETRSILSPTFTSSKMKMMYELIQECGNNLSNYLNRQDKIIDLEIKSLFAKYAVDVIGTTCFGVKCNSLDNPDNAFHQMSLDATNFGGLRSFKLMALIFFPKLMKALKTGIFSLKVQKFFKSIMRETIRVRQEKKIVRLDMVHLLLQARSGELKYEENVGNLDLGYAVVNESKLGKQQKRSADISDDDMAGLAVGFFASFDTVSTGMCYLTYELACNPDVQNKLFDEIKNAPKDQHGKIKYETLLKMEYLDMVISESLRKWPSGFLVDRECSKPFTIEPINAEEKPLQLNVGDTVHIPMVAIHRDPKYFPNPDKFDPERFNSTNKTKIVPFSYIPFGIGPRNCIGSRFAILEVKSVICELLRMFEVMPNEKTPTILPTRNSLFSSLPDGVTVRLKKRNICC